MTSGDKFVDEVWKSVPLYNCQVSNLGQLRIGGQVVECLPDRLGFRSHLIPARLAPNQQDTMRISHLVLLAFAGDCMGRRKARHLNGDNSDDRLGNLAWGRP